MAEQTPPPLRAAIEAAHDRCMNLAREARWGEEADAAADAFAASLDALAQPDAGEVDRHELATIVAWAREHGWNGVENSKRLSAFIHQHATPADTPPPSPQPSLTREERKEIASILETAEDDLRRILAQSTGERLRGVQAHAASGLRFVQQAMVKCRAHAGPETGR